MHAVERAFAVSVAVIVVIGAALVLAGVNSDWTAVTSLALEGAKAVAERHDRNQTK